MQVINLTVFLIDFRHLSWSYVPIRPLIKCSLAFCLLIFDNYKE